MGSISVEDASLHDPKEFEGRNWKQARDSFRKSHEDSERLRSFLQSKTDGDSVKGVCLRLKDQSENKYQQGLGGILDNIDALMTLGDIAIKSAPESVGLAWMGVRMCLHAVQGDWATFQLFSGACADIIGIMISCRVYGKMYSGKDSPKDFQELHAKVVDFIPQIYTEILEFSYAVYKYTQKHVVIRIGKNIFRDVKGEFEGQIKGIKTFDEKMRGFATTASDRMMIHLQNESIKNQNAMRLEVMSLKDTLDASLKANDAVVRRFFEELEEERKDNRKKTPYEKAQDEYEENMGYLKPSEVQYELLQENLDVHREPQTCRWIFDLNEYTQWHASPQSSMIWVSGAGGYGKSILMSTVIEELRAQHTDESKAVVQYFFCKAGTNITQNTSQILKTTVAHLYAHSLAFPDLLEQTNAAINKGLGKKDKLYTIKFNFEVAYSGLLQAMQRKVFLIIDGLDEVVDRKQEHLLRSLRTVAETAGSSVKIMVCSRPEPDIGIDLHGVAQIKCEGHNTPDIERNVTTEMRGFPGWTASEKRYAVKQIKEKAGGQFKFVQVALEFLRKPLIRPFEPIIDELPNGLAGSYITSWNATNPDYVELLKTALTWTLFADGSVTVPEIIDAYSRTYSAEAGVHEEAEEQGGRTVAQVDAGQIDLHDKQVRIAGGQFLEVSPSRHVSLRHLTVRDFFVAENEGSVLAGRKEPMSENNTTRKSSVQHEVIPGSPWTISAKQGHLEILKVLVQNLASSVFQKSYLFPRPSQMDEPEPEPEPESEDSKAAEEESEHADTDGAEENDAEENDDEAEDEGEDDDDNNEDDEDDDDDEEDEEEQVEEGGEGEWEDEVDGETEEDEDNIDAEAEVAEENEDEEEVEANEDDDDDDDSSSASSKDDAEARLESKDDGTLSDSPQDRENRYELTHWHYHFREAQKLWSAEEQQSTSDWRIIWNNLLKFMCEDLAAFQEWLRLLSSSSALGFGWRITHAGPLHVAAALSLTSLAQVLIDKKYQVNQAIEANRRMRRKAKSYTPLDFAVDFKNADEATIKLLVDHGANLNDLDTGRTPFCRAIQQIPSYEFIEYLIVHGADPSVKDRFGETAVHYFSITGTDPRALRLLLSARAEIDLINASSESGQTPLHKLVERKDDFPFALLEAYLEEGANVNSEDGESIRPLRHLALSGNAKAAEMLIGRGADIHDDDHRGQTAFHAAAQSGNAETLKLLLAKGAEVNLTDKNGETPLFLACQARNEETAMYLIQILDGQPESEINKANHDGRTPLREAAEHGNMALIDLLLSKTNAAAAINACDAKHQQTSVHKAAQKGRRAAIEMLIEHGGDLTLQDKDGLTPFQLCISSWTKRHYESRALEETLLLLIEKGKPPKTELDNLMFTAATKGSVRVAEGLINAGIDPRAEDAHGWTPLMVAQHYNQQGVIDLISRQRKPGGRKPSKWISSNQNIKISEDGLKVRKIKGKGGCVIVISDHPIPATEVRYYFEVEILSHEPDYNDPDGIVVGATTLPAKLQGHLLGFNVVSKSGRSYGWNGFTGSVCTQVVESSATQSGKWFEGGDVVGCAIDYTQKLLFFTHNGRRLGETWGDVSGRLYPAFSLGDRCVARANFGGDLENKPYKWKGWKAWSKGL